MIIVTHINPEPWAAGTTYTTRRKGGSLGSGISPNRKLLDYQSAIREELIDRVERLKFTRYPDDTPLFVRFWFWRQLDSVGTNNRGRKQTGHVADTTNMQKATEDAIQGVLTGNDKNNIAVFSEIVEQTMDTVPTVIIMFAPLRSRAKIQSFPTMVAAAARQEKLKEFQLESERAALQDRNAW